MYHALMITQENWKITFTHQLLHTWDLVGMQIFVTHLHWLTDLSIYWPADWLTD